jgi:hypothetical protein
MKPSKDTERETFVDEIMHKIKSLEIQDGSVRISIADNLVHEQFDEGFAWVRWICWSIHDTEGTYLVEPVYEVCSPTVTQELIRRDLGVSLGGLTLILDNDIQPDAED